MAEDMIMEKLSAKVGISACPVLFVSRHRLE
jgi:hypothetical protein